ncbi:unnamed protein product [Prorocentrum cordatum]|uniref:Uncharacterized protein n=1 Tax=Prorocentrum cordatum TaxID=2364126 RepID=A0ABN9SYX0_9DINO|nr:unnamed protein product [Polarella glacialis]
MEWFEMPTVGGPAIVSATLLCEAAFVRAALLTLPSWAAEVRALRRAERLHLPMVRWLRGCPWPSWWRAPPFAITLERAAVSEGSGPRPAAVRALRATLALAARREASRPSEQTAIGGEVQERAV